MPPSNKRRIKLLNFDINLFKNVPKTLLNINNLIKHYISIKCCHFRRNNLSINLRVFISFTKQFFTFHSNRVECEKQILPSVGFELTTSCIRGKRLIARPRGPHGRGRTTPRLIWNTLKVFFYISTNQIPSGIFVKLFCKNEH